MRGKEILLRKLGTMSKLEELSKEDIFNIKRYNRNLIEDTKDFWNFPKGAIVVHKVFKFLRHVGVANTILYFEDRGMVVSSKLNVMCKYDEYEMI